MKKKYCTPSFREIHMELSHCCAQSPYQTIPAINEPQTDVEGDVKGTTDWDIWNEPTPTDYWEQ